MEIALLLIIILILFLRLNTINDKLEFLQSNYEEIKDLLLKLKNQNIESIKTQPITKFNDAVNEIIEQPVPTFKPFDLKPVVIEKGKPEVESNLSTKSEIVEEYNEPIISEMTWWERFREQNPDLEKFVGENLISKIGVLILVLGVSYFVKYAIDKNWINEIARVGIGVLCGGIVLGVAHKLRADYKAFSSVLVAGAIAILYFTIAIAFHQYHIFNQTVAFVLMVVITAFSVLISVSYDRMELAILSLIGGFAVPFMLSTGEGNYQVLFTYIAILNIGILAIAYMRKWSLVNVIAFIFTVILFGGWLCTKVVSIPHAPFTGALFFATLFYLIFTFINIINNLRTNGLFSKIELSILITNTFLYFSVGMIIFSNFHPELKGVFTISLALFNLICAWVLFKKFGLDKNVIYLLIGLTLTFVTLTIPLQFKGNYITLFWAAEAILLLWLSKKSDIIYFRFASFIVHILMIGSLIIDWNQIYTSKNVATLLLNGAFIAGIFAAISLVGARFLTKNETENKTLYGIKIEPTQYQIITSLLSIAVLYLTGFLEIFYQSNQFYKGPYSPISITIAYHLVFSTLLVLFIQKKPNLNRLKFAIGLSLINIIMYILYFSNIPLGEFRENLGLVSTTKIAFIIHYISLICICYLCYIVWLDGKSNDSLSIFKQKWFIWLSAFTIVFIASNEILLHGIRMIIEPIISTNKDPNVPYLNYSKANTLIVKVAYPILWGVLAFLFLIIGIKKQNRNLRIVALSLLGITIVKLFTYDISNVSETGKIIAFILLGIMILVMSFAYQKIRKIVLENENPSEIEDEEK